MLLFKVIASPATRCHIGSHSVTFRRTHRWTCPSLS